MAESPGQQTATRRGLLDWFIGACGAVCGAAMVGPAAAYLWPITKTGPVKVREDVGDDASWAIWESLKVPISGTPILVIKTDKGYVAYSAVCTHLGCLVEFDPAEKDIKCPCHAASFDIEGQVTGGPPPRALPPYGVSVVQGRVYVST